MRNLGSSSDEPSRLIPPRKVVTLTRAYAAHETVSRGVRWAERRDKAWNWELSVVDPAVRSDYCALPTVRESRALVFLPLETALQKRQVVVFMAPLPHSKQLAGGVYRNRELALN